MDELFRQELDPKRIPLAVRRRPTSIAQIRGHEALTGNDGVIRRSIEGLSPFALVLAGPPGVGKTTLGSLMATERRARFVSLSATTLSVKDIKELAANGQRLRELGEIEPVCFIDEIHRLSRTQQDVLLHPVEDGSFSLVGATTENQFVTLSPALLSRVEVVRLSPLSDGTLDELIRSAVRDEEMEIGDDVVESIVAHANGDARAALRMLERAIGAIPRHQGVMPRIERVPYIPEAIGIDRSSHYEMTSALIKSMRASDAAGAIDWLAHLLVAGEDPRFVARRLCIFAAEDVGPDVPDALLFADATYSTVERIGMPEARIVLAAAVLRLSEAPKSRRAIDAIDLAMTRAATSQRQQVPPHLRGSITQIEARYHGSPSQPE